ncbi:MAG: NADH-quinone oxidoreductase subunit H [Eubacteriales bacterium]|nr:NADH-quinone oxidoreductase subunit H [Eubacteriales bacterium]
MTTVYSVISAVLYIILAPIFGALLAGLDRKITARMQGRQGPPLLQPLYDVQKLLKKQTKVINRVQMLYLLTFLFFILVTGVLFFAGYDVLFVLFTLTTANLFLVIAASSGHSPYAFMGAGRELVQMLVYEPMVLIAAIGLYVVTGSFKVSEIVVHNGLPAIIYLPGIFLGFIFILTIKLRKHPFDLSTSHHAHQEMVKGLTTEFNGKMFAIVEITHWYESIFLMGMLALFFLNNKWWSVILAFVFVAVCYFIEILVDNTNARLKWKTMFDNTWIVTAVLGAINLIVIEVLKGKGVI